MGDFEEYVKRKVEEEIDYHDEAVLELRGRYGECDRGGHRNPNKPFNRCDYCQRTLEHRTPETDEILKESERLQNGQRPVSLSSILNARKREIKAQQTEDYLRGVRVLKEEMKKARG